MRKSVSFVLAGMLMAVPALSFAQGTSTSKPTTSKPAASQTSKPAAEKKPAAPAAKATTGVVKSVDASSLVITKGKADMTFVINSGTEKKGDLKAGANVSVRYKTEGKQNIATAVTVQAKK